ncbi:hypothetical protein [Limosilactobacillus reuteri]|uniref:hypothetical protein n=1 Tax=Limosilactobacillus reuteri TaxID=1598 RepID=UPI001E37FD25|nr:hypothetical protein [Limosilactobacillus reuteri]MCC4485327.1 hypothetical protein [Limosilactobacillus reuteri]
MLYVYAVATGAFAISTIITAILFVMAINKMAKAEKEINGLLKHWKPIFIFLILICMVDYRMKLATQLVVNKKRHSA